jgi:hypothetical protein
LFIFQQFPNSATQTRKRNNQVRLSCENSNNWVTPKGLIPIKPNDLQMVHFKIAGFNSGFHTRSDVLMNTMCVKQIAGTNPQI